MFRLRGEDNRILIVDAMLHKRFYDAGLKSPYKTILSSVKRAKEIRNQYAHCHWDHNQKKGILRFIKLEDGAKSDETKLTWREIDLGLLEYQATHFHLLIVGIRNLLEEFKAREKGEPSILRYEVLSELEQLPARNNTDQ